MNRSISLFLLAVFILAGCSNTFQVYKSSIKAVLQSTEDVTFTWKEIENSSVHQALVQDGDGATFLMAEAFADNGRTGWVTSDRQRLLVIEQGRLVRTFNTTPRLLHLNQLTNDPLESRDFTQDFRAVLDWDNNRRSLFDSSFVQDGIEIIDINGRSFNVVKITENVLLKHCIDGCDEAVRFSNLYWFSTDSGKLIKQKFYLMDTEQFILMTYLSTLTESTGEK